MNHLKKGISFNPFFRKEDRMILFIAGLMIGTGMGVIIMGLMIASSDAERRGE